MLSDNDETAKKSGWGQLGHQWITAIAALVTALAGAGFFIGWNSAPEAKPTPATTATPAPMTVTVTASQDVRPVGSATSSAPPANTDKAIYWSGELTWGKLNLDINPPNYTDGEYITGISGDYLYSYGKAVVAAWKKGERPGKDTCGSAVDTDGSGQVRVAKGNQVCGRTAEGRIFLLDVTSIGNALRTQATVWNK